MLGVNHRYLYAQRVDLEKVVTQERDILDSKREIKILVSSEIIKQWEAVAKAKGLTLTELLINSTDETTKRFLAEYGAFKKQEDKKKQQLPLSELFAEHLKNRGK
jgi:hypothetical protein